MYKVSYRKAALKYLRKMPKNRAVNFIDAFKLIAKRDTEGLNITKFKQLDGAYRLRIGDYRAIYIVTKTELIIEVITIGSRGDVYK